MSTAPDPAGQAVRLDTTIRSALLDALVIGVIAFDREERVVYANAQAQRLLAPTLLVRGRPLAADCPLASDLRSRLRAGSRSQLAVAEKMLRVVAGGRLRGERSLALLLLEDVSTTERRDRARREFVANAAHELLSPVTGIVAAAHVLAVGAKDVPELRDRFVGHVVAAAEQLGQSARALLTLERAQSGQQPPRLELVPLRPLLEKANRVRGEVVLDCADDIVLLADADLATQAFSTLLANASRHSRGEAVSVTVREIEGRRVTIEISDVGGGIPPEQLERVGERFYSGAGRDSGGHGLGLSIAQQAVEAMGGSLELSSEPGRGTRACIRIASGRVVQR